MEFPNAAQFMKFVIPPIPLVWMHALQQDCERQRFLSPLFSWANLQKIKPLIQEKTGLIVSVIEHRFIRKPIDTLYVFRLLAVDIISFIVRMTTNIRRSEVFGV